MGRIDFNDFENCQQFMNESKLLYPTNHLVKILGKKFRNVFQFNLLM